MASNSSGAPPPGGFREAMRRGLGLKRTHRSPSRSPPPSLRLGGLLAPPAVTRSPSPALSNASNQSTTVQLVSDLSLGEAPHAPGPSAMSTNLIPNAPNTSPMTNPGSTTRHIHKKVKTAWTGLETALDTLKICAEVFPPLKSAVSDFASCLHIVKAAAENRKEYEELASELETTIDRLNKYANKLGSEDFNGSIGHISLSITEEAERIKKKQDRSKIMRMLESAQDREYIIECYRRVRALFGLLQDNVILWTVEKINEQDEFNLLRGMSPEEDARYNSYYSTTIKRRGCTAETRENIQADLQDWAGDPNGAKIYWMNGMAGTGKTTIAYSLCEWLETNKRLGANFFCSRAKDSCRDVSKIVPTIACQLARYSPTYRSALCKVLESDQGISKLDVVRQFDELVKGPLKESEATIPDGVVVVIDALDECADNYSVRLVLAALMRFAAALPVKFFVTSRPEPGICEKLESSIDYSPEVLRLHDIEQSIVEGDIKKYLREALSSVSPPPSAEQVEQLAKQAGKLFIYAATVVRYVLPDNVLVNSVTRLKMMLETSPQSSTNPQSRMKYKELDGLYTTILAAAFNEHLEGEEIEVIRLVLWTVVCANEPMNAQALASLLALTEQEVWSALQPLRSVLHVSEGDNVISTLHASFADYMLDRLRSGDFFCNKQQHSHLLADRCFEAMREQLRFNICGLQSSFMFDKDLPDLEQRIKQSISPALSYACRYWGDHLRQADSSDALVDKLVDFLSHRLLFWMEVLNLKQCVVAGVFSLSQTRGWLVANNAMNGGLKLVADAQDFVARFASSACTRSTPHIYLSALPFCAKESSVFKQYWGCTKGLMNVQGTTIKRRARAAISTWVAGSLVGTVGYSPDGMQIVCGSADGTIRVRGAHNGHTIAEFEGHTKSVNSVAFSPDSARIVSGSSDHTIRVWNTRTGHTIARLLEGHTDVVNSVVFSSDNACIVSGSSDRTIRVWDARTGDTIIGPLKGHTAPVNSVAVTANVTRIASGSNDCTIRLWDARTGKAIAEPFEGHKSLVNSVAFSPDGTCIVSGSYDCTIRVWDSRTGNTIAGPFRRHTGSVNSVAFSPGGNCIVSGSNDNTILVWDALTGDTIAGPFDGHTHGVATAAFSPNGVHVVSGSQDCTIRVWDSRIGDAGIEPRNAHSPRWCRSVAFSHDGSRIIAGGHMETIQLWDAHTGEPIGRPLKGHTDSVASFLFSPDSAYIVSGSWDCTIRVWHARTGATIAGPFYGHKLSINSVALSPDTSCIASGSTDRTIRMWDSRTGDTIAEPFEGHTASINSVAFSPDGTGLVSGSHDQTLRLWDVRTGGTITSPLHGHTSSVNSVAFSPDGTCIASGSSDKTVRLWDAYTGATIAEPLRGHTSSVTSVAFSPDGAHIVSGSFDRTIRVWDSRTGDSIAGPFHGHTKPVNSVAFSPEGNRIVSCSDDYTVRVWDVHAPSFANDLFGWQANLNSPLDSGKSAYPGWNLENDGWITLDNMPFVWVSPDTQMHFPLPPHQFSIGPGGSIRIVSWDLLLGKSWPLCYDPKDRQYSTGCGAENGEWS